MAKIFVLRHESCVEVFARSTFCAKGSGVAMEGDIPSIATIHVESADVVVLTDNHDIVLLGSQNKVKVLAKGIRILIQGENNTIILEDGADVTVFTDQAFEILPTGTLIKVMPADDENAPKALTLLPLEGNGNAIKFACRTKGRYSDGAHNKPELGSGGEEDQEEGQEEEQEEGQDEGGKAGPVVKKPRVDTGSKK